MAFIMNFRKGKIDSVFQFNCGFIVAAMLLVAYKFGKTYEFDLDPDCKIENTSNVSRISEQEPSRASTLRRSPQNQMLRVRVFWSQ